MAAGRTDNDDAEEEDMVAVVEREEDATKTPCNGGRTKIGSAFKIDSTCNGGSIHGK